MKKLSVIFLSAAMMLSLAACAKPTPTTQGEPIAQVMPAPTPTETPTPKPTPTPPPPRIGISMPTRGRWRTDIYWMSLKEQLAAAGYEVDMQFANNEVATQVQQIENMINSNYKVIIISVIDSRSLTAVLEQAKAKDVKVIAYDRLIENTEDVTYYVAFDNVMVGTLQGEYIRDTLKLDTAEGPFNIELITGDPGDINAGYFFKGAMDILNPYIESGKLVVPSGQTTFEQCATSDWSMENAHSRFENIIKANYARGRKLDAVMASNDSTAQGVTNALLAAGYTKDNFPIITGQDCDITSVENMLAGTQSMSVFKDTRTLAAKAVEMVDAIIKGTAVPVNNIVKYEYDRKEVSYSEVSYSGVVKYDRREISVPSFLCPPVVVTVDNCQDMFIDSGYYIEDLLKELKEQELQKKEQELQNYNAENLLKQLKEQELQND